jgi:integral membrane protein (TIGR01906 family)
MKHFAHKHRKAHAHHNPAPRLSIRRWWQRRKAAEPVRKRWYHRVRWKFLAILLLTPLVLTGLSIAIVAHTAPMLDNLLDRYSENPADAKTALHYYYTYIASPTEELPKIPGMTDLELEHLRDVRAVWRRAIVALLGLSICLGLLIWRAYKDRTLRPGLEYGSLATVALMIALQFVPFDDVWTWFHQLTFPQGNWMFEYNAKIVQLYTADFFEAVLLRVALLALFSAICVYGLAMVMKRGERRNAQAVAQAREAKAREAVLEQAATVSRMAAPQQPLRQAPPSRQQPARQPLQPPEELQHLIEAAKKRKE